jgi:hypothetical protein
VNGVNKVIVEKNTFQLNGNTVLSPEESFRKGRYEDLEKSRKQTESSKRLKELKHKQSVLKNILLVFIIGVTIISRYCMIYNYQNITSKARAEIELLGKENDSYKVDLIKFKNISYIQKAATEKLHMVKPKISDIQYVNLSKNNLQVKEELQVKKSTVLLKKIKNIIF